MATIPIQSLTPDAAPPADGLIRAIVTLSWPYSSSTRQCALLLADPDFRLRHRKGQVRVRFTEDSAEAVAKSRVGIGDQVVLKLDGASWGPSVEAARTPGKSVEGELIYARRLGVTIARAEGEVEVAVDAPTPPRSPERTANGVAQTPKGVRNLFPSLDGDSRDSGPVYSSPAFAKRLRLLGDSFVDSAYDPFVDDVKSEHRPNNLRMSFSGIGQWRYTEKTPSPIKDTFSPEPEQVEPQQIVSEEDRTTPLKDSAHSLSIDVGQAADSVTLRMPLPTMAPPSLPRLGIPGGQTMPVAGESEASAKEPTDLPSTPKLKAVPNSALLQPSPLPMDTTQPSFTFPSSDQPLQPSTEGPPAHEAGDSSAVHASVGQAQLMTQPPSSSQEIRDYESDTEEDDELYVRDYAPPDDVDTEESPVHSDVDMGEDSNSAIHDHEMKDAVSSPGPGERKRGKNEESLGENVRDTQTEIEDRVEPLDNTKAHEESENGKRLIQLEATAPVRPHTPSKSITGALGLDGATPVVSPPQSTPQSEKDKVMAQTFKSLFGFRTSPEAQPMIQKEMATPTPKVDSLDDLEQVSPNAPNQGAEEPLSPSPQPRKTSPREGQDRIAEMEPVTEGSTSVEPGPYGAEHNVARKDKRIDEADRALPAAGREPELTVPQPPPFFETKASSFYEAEVIELESSSDMEESEGHEEAQRGISPFPTSPQHNTAVIGASSFMRSEDELSSTSRSSQMQSIDDKMMDQHDEDREVALSHLQHPEGHSKDQPQQQQLFIPTEVHDIPMAGTPQDAESFQQPYKSPSQEHDGQEDSVTAVQISTEQMIGEEQEEKSEVSGVQATPAAHDVLHVTSVQVQASPEPSKEADASTQIPALIPQGHDTSHITPPASSMPIEVIELGSSSPVQESTSTDSQIWPAPDTEVPEAAALLPDPVLTEHDHLQVEDVVQADQLPTRSIPHQTDASHGEAVPAAEVGEAAAESQTAPQVAPHKRQEQSTGSAATTETVASYPTLPPSPLNSQPERDIGELAAVHQTLQSTTNAPPPTPQLTKKESDLQAPQTPEAPTSREPESQADVERPISSHEPSKPSPKKKAPSRKSLAARISNVPDVISAWFSPKSSSGDASEQQLAKADGATDESKAGDALHNVQQHRDGSLPLPVSRQDLAAGPLDSAKKVHGGILTTMGYFTPLSRLHERLNSGALPAFATNLIDVLAVVTEPTKAPERATRGPRDYYTILRVADASLPANASVRVEAFRPWKAKLPKADAGDVVLLRSFVVKSRERQPYLLSTTESSWCVWRYYSAGATGGDDDGPVWTRTRSSGTRHPVREEIKGPPVEFGDEEREHVKSLREWWLALHDKSKGEEPTAPTQDVADSEPQLSPQVAAKL